MTLYYLVEYDGYKAVQEERNGVNRNGEFEACSEGKKVKSTYFTSVA